MSAPGAAAGEREALVAATIDLVIDHGYDLVTAEMICDRAGVDRAGFERHFADKADCCLQVYEHYAGRFDRRVFAAYDSELDWRDSIRAGAYAAARFFADHQRPLLFSTVALLSAGDLLLAHREATMQRHVDQIDRGRFELADPDSLTRSTAEVVIGSIFALIVRRLPEEGAENVDRLVPEMMYMVVRPYLGHQVAREELSISPPTAAGGSG